MNTLQLDTSVSHSANGFRRPRSIFSQAVRFKSSSTNRAPFGGRWWRSDARRRCRSLSDFLLTAPPLEGPWCVGCLIDVIKSVAICGNNVANCSCVQKKTKNTRTNKKKKRECAYPEAHERLRCKLHLPVRARAHTHTYTSTTCRSIDPSFLLHCTHIHWWDTGGSGY